MHIEPGHFYFLADEFFRRFPSGTMPNKPDDADGKHHRPYYFAMRLDGLDWMIPVSSKVAKYRAVHAHKLKKHGKCFTLFFADVLGRERAFLIQNMVPASPGYVTEQYKDGCGVPVRLRFEDEAGVRAMAERALDLVRKGKIRLFTDISGMAEALRADHAV